MLASASTRWASVSPAVRRAGRLAVSVGSKPGHRPGEGTVGGLPLQLGASALLEPRVGAGRARGVDADDQEALAAVDPNGADHVARPRCQQPAADRAIAVLGEQPPPAMVETVRQ